MCIRDSVEANHGKLARIVCTVLLKSVFFKGSSDRSKVYSDDLVQFTSSVVYAALKKVVAFESADSRERLVAKFFVQVIKGLNNTDSLQKLASHVFYEFVVGNFFELEAINLYVTEEFQRA